MLVSRRTYGRHNRIRVEEAGEPQEAELQQQAAPLLGPPAVGVMATDPPAIQESEDDMMLCPPCNEEVYIPPPDYSSEEEDDYLSDSVDYKYPYDQSK